MSGLVQFVLPADVRALKRRVAPMVQLVDAIVRETTSLDPALRADWERFAKQWDEYLRAPEEWRTSGAFQAGEELEQLFRGWKSCLSSLCFGVPGPAPKRAVPLLPTWVTPNTVREEKGRIEPRVRALGLQIAGAAALSGGFVHAWRAFVAGWSAFAGEPEEWTHAAAQFECARAYEDQLPEWDDAFRMSGTAGGAQGAPSLPLGPSMAPGGDPSVAPGVGPSLVPGPEVSPWAAGGTSKPASNTGIFLGVGVALAALLLAMSRGARA